MSVIVKGMDMPTECRECPFAKFGTMSGETYCWVNGVTLAKNFEVISFDGRPDWCPLVALPDKHGRLVDADALVVAIDRYFAKEVKRLGYDSFQDADTQSKWYLDGIISGMEVVMDAPTIVEAEGE